MQQPKDITFVLVSPRGDRGQPAHGFLMGCHLVGKKQNARYNNRTQKQKKPGKDDIDAPKREEVLYALANICTTMIPDKRTVVDDVARAIRGSLVIG